MAVALIARSLALSGSINPERLNLDVNGDGHLEAIPLADGDAEIRAVKGGDGVGAAHLLLRRR